MCYRSDNTMGNWFTTVVSTVQKGASVAQQAIDRTNQVLTTVRQPPPIVGVPAASSPTALNIPTGQGMFSEMPNWILPAALLGAGFLFFASRRRGRRAA